MKQDFTKNYERWIDGLTKDQFDSLMRVFIKEFWMIETVTITDGKGDGGIDVKIFEDKKNKKIPLQITIDKNVYPKLEKDLIKIEKLIQNNDYSDNFYFFYSHGASESKVIDLTDAARINHSISLHFFDNKLISTYIDKPHFFMTRETLRDLLGEFVREEKTYFDENQKLYYDYLSYADGSNQLKESFIKSYVLNLLYESKDQKSELNGITEQLNKEFNINVTHEYCTRQLKELFEKGKIIKCENGIVQLSADEIVNIKSVKENSHVLEGEFLFHLQKLIESFNSEIEIRIVINHLESIYESNNKIDLNEISDSVESSYLDETVSQFHLYVKECFNSDDTYKVFLKEVFQLCSENTYMINLSAGNLYKNLMDNPEFYAYINRTNKEIYIDTPVLIYLFLAMQENNFSYENYRYRVVLELFNLIKNNDGYTNFSTTQLYIIELADHVSNAVKLIALDDIDLLQTLGGSKNEVVNLYHAAKKEVEFEGSLKDFVESFGISINRIDFESDNEYLIQNLTKLFKVNNILVDDVPPYNRNFQTKKDFDRIEKSLAEIYSRDAINRRPRSLMFDALLVEHINEIQNELVDPTIMTWDNSFQSFRKDFYPKNPNFKCWHLFTPGKFIDHLSLLKFKINSSAVSKEVLALIETEYDVVEGIKKLSDVLSSIVDLKSASGVKLSIGLAEIRETYIFQINKEQHVKISVEEVQPIDNVFINLVDYYYNKLGKYSIKDFNKVLSLENVINDLLGILKNESDHYMKNKKYSSTYKSKFDMVISINLN
jgi:hypothetical protein